MWPMQWPKAENDPLSLLPVAFPFQRFLLRTPAGGSPPAQRAFGRAARRGSGLPRPRLLVLVGGLLALVGGLLVLVGGPLVLV